MIKIERFVVGPLETNCYLVYSDKTKSGFLIDPGYYHKEIEKFIKENNIKIKSIINTHGHFDHTTGNSNFNYPIMIHEKDSDFLRDSKGPVRFLKDKEIIKEGEIELEVIHTPGHTPGGISLKMGDKIFTGDTLFCEGVGRTDMPYGNEHYLFNSIKERLMVFDDDTEILPGHGPSSTIGHERKANQFI